MDQPDTDFERPETDALWQRLQDQDYLDRNDRLTAPLPTTPAEQVLPCHHSGTPQQ
jgi:hypothetical protein